MAYGLGVDLGTTFTAAAVGRDRRVEVATLGTRSAAVPSVVLLREDETVLAGEVADRRGLAEPQRVAREFKRRLGDPAPIVLAGSPQSADQLMARLLQWVVDEVSSREGERPAHVTLSHPANWGPYKRELLEQIGVLAGIPEVSYVPEPEAAAGFYASTEKVEPGDLLAVYDLGGGTFDASVLQKLDDGFEILGEPAGIERLGGIDFDAGLVARVTERYADELAGLDHQDPGVLAALVRLRQECVLAKESLSSDTDVSIPVLLPDVQGEVRVTRGEFEAMIRPSLVDTVASMGRALEAADVAAEDLVTILLIGGSSRIPLVGELVTAEFGRPTAVDAHPKHVVALGAGRVASQRVPASAAPAPDDAGEAPPPPSGPPPAQPSQKRETKEPAGPVAPPDEPAAAPEPEPGSAPEPEPVAAPDAAPSGPPPAPDEPEEAASGGVLVKGIRCVNDHHNNPLAKQCAACGTEIDVQSTLRLIDGPRPPLGRLHLADGGSVLVEADLVIGRDPTADRRVAAGAVPVTVTDTSNYVSRAHCLLLLDEWDVLVADGGSRNGTYVQLPKSTDWLRLQPDQRLPISGGARVWIGGQELVFDRNS